MLRRAAAVAPARQCRWPVAVSATHLPQARRAPAAGSDAHTRVLRHENAPEMRRRAARSPAAVARERTEVGAPTASGSMVAEGPQDRQLTKLITSAASIKQLESLFDRHEGALNAIHLTALFTRLVALQRCSGGGGGADNAATTADVSSSGWPASAADDSSRSASSPGLELPQAQAHDRVAGRLLAAAERQLDAFSARGLANSFWAAVQLRAAFTPGSLELWLQHIRSRALQLQPQHISSILYSLAKLHGRRWPQPQSQQRRGVAGTAARGSLEAAEAAASGRRELPLPAPPPRCWEPRYPSDETLDALLRSAAAQLPAFGTQAASNTLYALALLDYPPDEGWLCGCLDQLQPKLMQAEPQHLSNSAWALARLGFHPGDDWLRSCGLAAALKLPLFSGQQLAVFAWALATLGAAPDGQLLRMLMREALQQAGSHSPQDLSMTLWSVATLVTAPGGSAPGGEEDGATEAMGGDDVSQEQRRALSPSSSSLSQTPSSLSSSSLSSSSATAAAGLDRRQVLSWLNGYLPHVTAAAPCLSSQQTSNVLTALAALQHTPSSALMEALAARAAATARAANALELSATLVAFAKLQWPPGPRFLVVWQQASMPLLLLLPSRHGGTGSSGARSGVHSDGIGGMGGEGSGGGSSSSGFQPRQLGAIVWALGRLRFRPTDRWLAAFWSACAACCRSAEQPPPAEAGSGSGGSSDGSSGGSEGQKAEQEKEEEEERFFTSRNLANVMWALGRLQLPPPPWLLVLLLADAGAAARSFTSQGLSCTLWGLSRLGGGSKGRVEGGPAAEAALAALVTEAQGRLPTAGPQALSTLLWSLARLRHTPPLAWIQALETAATRQLRGDSSVPSSGGGFSSQGTAMVVCGFAMLRYKPGPAFFAALFAPDGPTARRLAAMPPRHLAMLLSAAVVRLEQPPPEAWLERFAQAWQTASAAATALDLHYVARALKRLPAVPASQIARATAGGLKRYNSSTALSQRRAAAGARRGGVQQQRPRLFLHSRKYPPRRQPQFTYSGQLQQ